MKPTVDKVLPLAKAFYALDGNACGGHLHIVLDDGNLKDTHVQYCRDQATKAGDWPAIELATLLLHMTITQRKAIYNRLHRHAPQTPTA